MFRAILQPVHDGTRETLNHEVWTALTFVLGLTFRPLAIRYKWEMPKFVFSEDQR
jgi:uncharacterized membrane protein YeiH